MRGRLRTLWAPDYPWKSWDSCHRGHWVPGPRLRTITDERREKVFSAFRTVCSLSRPSPMGGSEIRTTRKSSFERQRREEDADADSGGWAGTRRSAPAGWGRRRDLGGEAGPVGGRLLGGSPRPALAPPGSRSLRAGAGGGRGAEYQVTAEETRLWPRSKPSGAGPLAGLLCGMFGQSVRRCPTRRR